MRHHLSRIRLKCFTLTGHNQTQDVEQKFLYYPQLVSRVAICCLVCGKQSFVTHSYRSEDQTVNTKSILAMMTIGKGRESLDTFTAMSGMLPPVSKPSYSSHNEKITAAMSLERETQFSAAATLLWKDAAPEEIVDIRVTSDGTWSRLGHQAKYGVAVVAS